MMAGRFANQGSGAGLREWNAMLDPHATALVYRAAAGIHRSIGHDVTEQLKMSAVQIRQHMPGNRSKILGDMIETWFRTADSITFHDPLAAATIFVPHVCRFDRGIVEVELASEQLQGLTHWRPDALNSWHEIATQVDTTTFFEHYFSIVH
jgi:inosine-uridine nucleoside N-ribohydrolase